MTKHFASNSSSNSDSKSNSQTILTSLRDFIGLITAGLGIFAALLYLAGRSYASGYFGAMNIPEYMVSFSLQEYGAASWLPLFGYPITALSLGWIFLWALYKIRNLISSTKWFLSVRAWLILHDRSQKNNLREKHLSQIFDFIAIVVILIVFISSTLFLVADIGEKGGKFEVLEGSSPIDIISTAPLALENGNSAAGQFYIYRGYKLLTLNNGKYYLFKDIDLGTCKPTHVFVIDADQIKQVILSPATSLANQCTKNLSLQLTSIPPNPTP